MNGPGHNSVSVEELLQLIERWEHLNIEKRDALLRFDSFTEAYGYLICVCCGKRVIPAGIYAPGPAPSCCSSDGPPTISGPRNQPTNGDTP